MDVINTHKNILFSIVTYNEIFFDCITFKTLLDSYKKTESHQCIFICIVDNTDVPNWKIDMPKFERQIHIHYIKLNNPGISVAYNNIYEYAKSQEFEWIVFFDQDTQLSDMAYKVYKENANKSVNLNPIKCPIVLFPDKTILSPSKYKLYRSFLFKNIYPCELNIDNISCINSGLMLSTLFYGKNGRYNEKLKLDFCDHDFIERAKIHIKKLEILPLHFVQNFSSKTNTLEQALKRYEFYCCDIKEFKKGRNKYIIFFTNDFPRLIKLIFQYKSLKFIIIRLNLKFK